MKAHARSDSDIHATEMVLSAESELSVMEQVQTIGVQEMSKNRAAVKSPICCTHFPKRTYCTLHKVREIGLFGSNHLVDKIWRYIFLENVARNSDYRTTVAVVEFIQALGIWVEVCPRSYQETCSSCPIRTLPLSFASVTCVQASNAIQSPMEIFPLFSQEDGIFKGDSACSWSFINESIWHRQMKGVLTHYARNIAHVRRTA